MKCATALAAMLLVAGGALSGARGAQEPEKPPLTFRSGTELVRLDVRIVGEDGRPVADLRADEVEIIEDGRSRPVLLFQHVSQPSAPIVEVAQRTVAGEVSTNQGAFRGHLYVLIFDQGHIASGNELRARAAAAQFLRTRVRPGDRVALYGVPGPGPQIDFTSNVTRAIEGLTRVRGGLERFSYGAVGPMRIDEAFEITRGNQYVLNRVAQRLSSERGNTDVLAAVGSSAPGAGGSANNALFQMLVTEDARTMVARADQQARNFLQMFADVIRQLRPIEGRKSVILFSEGFYTDNVTRELEQVAAAAAEAYVVIHALDLNKRQLDIREPEPLGAQQYTEIQSRLGVLGSLAAETDGLLMIDASEALDASLARVAEHSQDYYLIGFEPLGSGEAQYRRVNVRVTRPGARVHARTGYSAAVGTEARGDRRRRIDAALKAPFPQQGLPVRYTTYVLRGTSPGMQKVFMSLACDLPVAGDNAGRADVVFVVRNAQDGRVMASGTDTIPLPGSPASGATTGTGEYKVQFELPAGAYLMRAVVREPGGLVGTADRRFEVRRLDRPDVTFSDLVLGDERGALPVRAVAYTERGLSGVLELYSPNSAMLEKVSVSMELAQIGSQNAATVVAADLQPVHVNDALASRTARLSLPIGSVPAGDYIVTATVRAGGEQVGRVTREVRIAEGAPAPTAAMAALPSRPADVLDGRPAREYVRQLHAAATGTAVEAAAAHALRGEWRQALAALPADDGGHTAVHDAVRGLARLGTGDYAGAAADLRRAYDAGNRSNALTGFVLGWAYEAAGDRREALSAWRGAVYVDPRLVPAHLALADAYVQLAQPALAVQALRAGLAALPDSPELMNRLAELQKHF